MQADINTPEGEKALEQYGQAYEVLSNTEAKQAYDKETKDKYKDAGGPQTLGDVASKAAVDSKGAAIDLKDALQPDDPEDRAQLIGKAVTALGQSLGQGKL